MSGESPERPSKARALRALGVPRKARIGLAVGLVVAVVAGVAFVPPNLAPTDGLLYAVLAFVVVVATGALVTVVLTVRTIARATIDPPKWIRRAGTASLAGGVAWVALVATGPVAGAVPGSVYGWAFPLATVGLLAGTWGVRAAHRDGGYPGPAGAVLSGVGLAVLAGFVASDPGVALGRPVRADPGVLVLVELLALAGTWLLGAEALQRGALPRWVALAALFALPAALAGLTAVASLGRPGLVAVAPSVALGTAWAALGSALRAGRGVPPAEAFSSPDLGLDTAEEPGEG